MTRAKELLEHFDLEGHPLVRQITVCGTGSTYDSIRYADAVYDER